MALYFVLEGTDFDPAKCTLVVRRKGETGSWDCNILKSDSSTSKLVGWFKYKPKTVEEEMKNDDKDTEELEFVVTNPNSPPVTFPSPVTVVDDP